MRGQRNRGRKWRGDYEGKGKRRFLFEMKCKKMEEDMNGCMHWKYGSMEFNIA